MNWEGKFREAQAEVARIRQVCNEYARRTERAEQALLIMQAHELRANAAERRIAKVEGLLDEWEQAQAYNRANIGSFMRSTPQPADFWAALIP